MTGVRYGASTEVGMVREINEDSKLHEPPLFAVADGMGGHSAGDVASNTAIRKLAEQVIDDSEALTAAVREANKAVFEMAAGNPALSGMGTTMTAMYAGETSAQIAHVGDSRAYLLRRGELKRLTQDHTYVGRLVQQGRLTEEEAERHPSRNLIERALGMSEDITVDVNVLDIEPGDRILLCSDGLHGMIDEDLIIDILLSEPDPEAAAKKLCTEAVAAGGHDNVTAIVVDYPTSGGSESLPSKLPRTKSVETSPLPSNKNSRWKAYALIAAVLIVGSGLSAKVALGNSWYVGRSSGKVTVFNGIPGKVAGVSLSRPERSTEIEYDALPPIYQRQLDEGMRADDLSDALSIVSNLRQIVASSAAPQTGTPTATATPAASQSP